MKLFLPASLLALSTSSFAFAPSRQVSVIHNLYHDQELNKPSTIKLWSTESETIPPKNKLYEEEFDQVYPRKSLEELIAKAASGFHNIVKNGIPDRNIRPLDPLQLGTLTRNIKRDKIDVTLTLNNPVLEGLDTVKLVSTEVPELFQSEGVLINLSIKFEELVLSCDSYDREGSFKLLFKDRDISKIDRTLTVSLSDVTKDFSFKLRIQDGVPKVEAMQTDAQEQMTIGKVKTSVDDSYLFKSFLLSFFKESIAKALSSNLDNLVASTLTDRLRNEAEKFEPSVKALEGLYKQKQKQGLLVDSEGNELKPRILTGLGDVGQVAYPAFWEMPGVPMDKLDHMTTNELVKTLKTGDLLMFQGVAPGANMIRRYTQSPFSHTLMFIKEDDFFGGKPVVFQGARAVYFDLFRQEEGNGLQVNPVKHMLDTYNTVWGLGSEHAENPARVCFRSINMEPRSEEEEKVYKEALYSFLRETNGIPYTEGMSMIELWAKGVMEIDLTEKQNERTFYCASYVAEAMMKYGIITDEFKHEQYSPRDFSMKYDVLPFTSDSTSYGPEIVVDIHDYE